MKKFKKSRALIEGNGTDHGRIVDLEVDVKKTGKFR